MDIISSLPVEISDLILENLKAIDLSSCGAVNQEWHSRANRDRLWRKLCAEIGVGNLSMVSDYRTHKSIRQNSACGFVEQLSQWKLNYIRNIMLPQAWENNISLTYDLKPNEVPVTCLNCNSDTLAVGHNDGTVILYDVKYLPSILKTFRAFYPTKIQDIRVHKYRIILIQHLLLQIFDLDGNLVSVKTFSEGAHNVEWFKPSRAETTVSQGNTYDSSSVLQDMRDDRSMFVRSRNQNHDLRCLSFELNGDLVYVGFRNYPVIYCWSCLTGNRENTIFLTKINAKVRQIALDCERVYVIFAYLGQRYISCFVIRDDIWQWEIKPEVKTERVILGRDILVGIGIPGCGGLYNSVLNVYDKLSGRCIAKRGLKRYVQAVQLWYEAVVYSESSLVTIWNPFMNAILKEIPLDSNALGIHILPYRFFLVGTCRQCITVFDGISGKALWNLPANLNKENFDTLVWSDRTMMFTKSKDGHVRMTVFC